MNRFVAFSLLCLLTFARNAHAQVISGRWDRVDALTRGSPITVTVASGDRAEYMFVTSSTELLTVINDNGRELRIAKADVRTVERTVRDRLRNGTLTGAGVGFGAGFFALAAFNNKQTASGPIWDRESVGYYVVAGLIGAGIGALTGAAIDASHKTTEVLYFRP